jgi:hypothetical protein
MRMKNYLKSTLGAMLERTGLIPAQRAAIFSIWDVECYDKDGNLKWTEHVHNLVTNQGLDHILETQFKSGTQITTWYVCIFNDDYTVLAANTYASKGFTESTAYAETVRPTWVGGTVSGQSVDNSASKATFTMNASETIYGAALVGGVGADVKNDSADTDGRMYCSAQFSASKSVVADDVLKVTVTLTSSSV